MTRISPHHLRLALLVALTAISGCGDDETTSPPPPPNPRVVASLVVHAPRAQLAKGDDQPLTVVALNADGDTLTGVQVSWASSDDAVLTVDGAGKVTAVGFGTAATIASVDSVEGRLELTVPQLAFTALALGDGVSCGLTAEGAAWCWGNVGSGGFGGMPGGTVLTGIPRLASDTLRFMEIRFRVSGSGGCGTLTDRRAVCWGTNTLGELGDGTNTTRTIPAEVPGLSGVEAVRPGRDHACALLQTGEVNCWGDNAFGQLGDGTYAGRTFPAPVPGLSAVSLGSGVTHSCAVEASGTGRCWGNDRQGQLGNDTSYVRTEPQLVPGLAATWVAAGGRSTCALDASGATFCWGSRGFGLSPSLEAYEPTRVEAPPFSRVSTSQTHSCGLALDDSIWCWGNNRYGQLGRGWSLDANYEPAKIASNSGFSAVGVGIDHTCALDGSGAPWCWGLDVAGSIGVGDLEHGAYPSPERVHGGQTFVSLGVGWSFACALDGAGKAWCWGDNDDSALGSGVWNVSAAEPVPVYGARTFTAIFVGPLLGTCATEAGGQAWCWGQMYAGDGLQYLEYVEPVAVSLSAGLRLIAPGDEIVCGQGLDELTWCWGSLYHPDPVQLVGAPHFVQLVAGQHHVCGREANGAVYCWGAGVDGQLGTGLRPSSPVPLDVDRGDGFMWTELGAGTCMGSLSVLSCWGGTGSGPAAAGGLVSLDAGEHHSCGVAGDQRAWCSGGQGSQWGELGELVPGSAPLEGGHLFHRTWVGSRHSCGLTAAGLALCWGRNPFGELGRGTTGNAGANPTPAPVLGQQ